MPCHEREGKVFKLGCKIEIPGLKTPFTTIFNGFEIDKWNLISEKKIFSALKGVIPESHLIVSEHLNKFYKISYPNSDKYIGYEIPNQLSKINDKILMDFKKQEEKLKNKEIKLISQKNILSENDFDTNIKNFKAEIEQYNVNRKKTITNFNKKKNENTKELL